MYIVTFGIINSSLNEEFKFKKDAEKEINLFLNRDFNEIYKPEGYYKHGTFKSGKIEVRNQYGHVARWVKIKKI